MHLDLMFPSRYLKASDLRGKDVVLTIRKIVKQEMETKEGKKMKWHLYFEETRKAAEKAGDLDAEKRYVFPVTVGKQIKKATGEPDGEKWVGKRITLYATQCNSFGEIVDCIRVRETAPAAVPVTETATVEKES